jgi:hypothetical protein
MESYQVKQILDATRPWWEEEFVQGNFETFEDMVKAMNEALNEGLEKLGIEASQVH